MDGILAGGISAYTQFPKNAIWNMQYHEPLIEHTDRLLTTMFDRPYLVAKEIYKLYWFMEKHKERYNAFKTVKGTV